MQVIPWRRVLAGPVCLALASGGSAFAQSGSTTHKHYEESAESKQPSPTGELAPRLQKLGAHTFPVTAKSKQAQLFIARA